MPIFRRCAPIQQFVVPLENLEHSRAIDADQLGRDQLVAVASENRGATAQRHHAASPYVERANSK